jgi:hypothetical protein
MTKCLFCSNTDLTAEHHFKKSEAKKTVNHSDYFAIFVEQNLLECYEKKIQGANSTLLKFNPSICSKCNNVVSQSGDDAFSRLNELFRNDDPRLNIHDITDVLNNDSRINCKDPDDYIYYLSQNPRFFMKLIIILWHKFESEKTKHLYSNEINKINSYFSKILACTLADNQQKVPKALTYLFKMQRQKKLNKITKSWLFLMKTNMDFRFAPISFRFPFDYSDLKKGLIYSCLMQIEDKKSYLFFCHIKKPSESLIEEYNNQPY